jgi:hypothetical protein
MSVQNTDLLLVQRGTVPYKTTAEELASYSNTQIELGDGKDVPIASGSQLGVVKVGNNLTIDSGGVLAAVIPSGTEYQGVWIDPNSVPSGALNGNFWVWDGGNGVTLNNAGWGTANGETVSDGDRLFYDGSTFDVVPGGGGGIVSVDGTAPIVVDNSNADHPDISITAASSSSDGYMSSADFDKLDGISPGAEVNVDPQQTFVASATSGTLTLQPGGDTTIIPIATDTDAGLLSAADKTVLDNLVASPGGVLSIVAGDGIEVNTVAAPGSAGTPEVLVKFAGSGSDATTLVMPADLNLLQDLS